MILLISVVLGVLFNNSFLVRETPRSSDYNSDKEIEDENKKIIPTKESESNKSYPEEEEYEEYYPEEEEYEEYYPEEEEYEE